ncbi:M23 family metallopeptidase [Catenovulum sp. 2E275]|uniref:M23 family metallopeptidase n=1 Tax=Catenovulum sp. 2E275 TaxID=2980497 RepID=UPI0021D1C86B|nr:M23 family metallopeptidase [Catenovulum sp. 2E275]MCU4676502.1 M23 family metallopeptidase [Catenovulum sp. 2E275]
MKAFLKGQSHKANNKFINRVVWAFNQANIRLTPFNTAAWLPLNSDSKTANKPINNKTVSKLTFSVLISSLFLTASHTALANPADTIKINQQALQPGGFVKGQLNNCLSYQISDSQTQQQGKCTQEGAFLFGFGRDADLTQTATFTLADNSTLTHTFTLQSRDYKIDRVNGVPSKTVNPPQSVLDRISKENGEIWLARNKESNSKDFLQSFIWPAKGRISGVYGSQRVFNGTPKRPHFGLDIAAPTGTQIIAPADGVITVAHPDMFYSGGTIILDHGFGISSTFIHMSKLHVKKGDTVKQGELIGEIGKTGRATGPHLDWRINWYQIRLDPAFWVPAGGHQ